MAFDVGTKKTGVAIGQTVTQTANPLMRISTHASGLDWRALDRLVEEWKPNAFVVGIPLNMDGSLMKMTHIARQYVADLAKHYPKIPIHEVDERLTTKAVKELVFERYGYQGLQSKDIDSLSACLLLEQWMKYEK